MSTSKSVSLPRSVLWLMIALLALCAFFMTNQEIAIRRLQKREHSGREHVVTWPVAGKGGNMEINWSSPEGQQLITLGFRSDGVVVWKSETKK